MSIEQTTLPKKFHDAVLHWQRHHFPDYGLLPEMWHKYFPNDPEFCLCAKMEVGMGDTIEVGDQKGQPRMLQPSEMSEDQGRHLLAIIRAQASTEFGSIQQHEVTLSRAQEDEDRFWVLRVMAEELRHGYQMFYMLTSQDWSRARAGAGSDHRSGGCDSGGEGEALVVVRVVGLVAEVVVSVGVVGDGGARL